MNVTFLIGNGFDLNIGLETTYSAFLKDYGIVTDKDSELIKLENQLNNNKNKSTYTQMLNIAKEAQNKSNQLEKQAGDLLLSYEQLKKTFEENIKSANIVSAKNLNQTSITDGL